uniref:Centromere protein Cenp-F N-terminal domain-containing protein n=1 Tax=Oryzias latipes TaxID=8090 RepID=A0A3P9K2B9_ORYLA
MSWAVEEWKDGLPGKALQKIQEMEVQLDKLKKERTQKQFQLDSLEAALQKQKQKLWWLSPGKHSLCFPLKLQIQ